MDWLDKMNAAISYIEENLDGHIDYSLAAKTACCSDYHFQRMFSFIIGLSLSEYIRRRRLTMAAFDLRHPGVRVIDVALRYGYESHGAFSRAFKALHGVSPSLVRKPGTALKAYPRISFQLAVKGAVEMNYRIETKDAFHMFGAAAYISTRNLEEAFLQVPGLCREWMQNGAVTELNALLGRPPGQNMPIALFDFTGEGFRYMLCQPVPEGLRVPDKFYRLSVPALTWAIFPVPERDVPQMWRRLYTEWFPTSGYEQAEGPQFEMYRGTDREGSCEVWIPVKKL